MSVSALSVAPALVKPQSDTLRGRWQGRLILFFNVTEEKGFLPGMRRLLYKIVDLVTAPFLMLADYFSARSGQLIERELQLVESAQPVAPIEPVRVEEDLMAPLIGSMALEMSAGPLGPATLREIEAMKKEAISWAYQEHPFFVQLFTEEYRAELIECKKRASSLGLSLQDWVFREMLNFFRKEWQEVLNMLIERDELNNNEPQAIRFETLFKRFRPGEEHELRVRYDRLADKMREKIYM